MTASDPGLTARIERAAAILLALAFFVSGLAKLLGLDFEAEAFSRWGYPLWFMYLTGGLELLGAFGLLIYPSSGISALALAGLMTGALATHVLHGEAAMAALALGLWSALLWLAYRRRQQVYALAQRLLKLHPVHKEAYRR